ncbi:hypothetical protein [Candidatus Poriferisodalis sp.]|uniref:hypothetical protein n=1 Tax=Candidatus Poriferisodalis sp. TaxID=3101277 RepID=UPI003B025E30
MSQRIGISWRTAAALAAAVVLLPLLVFVDLPESAAHTKTVRRCIVDPPVNHCWDEKVAHTHPKPTPTAAPDPCPPPAHDHGDYGCHWSGDPHTTTPPTTAAPPPPECPAGQIGTPPNCVPKQTATYTVKPCTPYQVMPGVTYQRHRHPLGSGTTDTECHHHENSHCPAGHTEHGGHGSQDCRKNDPVDNIFTRVQHLLKQGGKAALKAVAETLRNEAADQLESIDWDRFETDPVEASKLLELLNPVLRRQNIEVYTLDDLQTLWSDIGRGGRGGAGAVACDIGVEAGLAKLTKGKSLKKSVRKAVRTVVVAVCGGVTALAPVPDPDDDSGDDSSTPQTPAPTTTQPPAPTTTQPPFDHTDCHTWLEAIRACIKIDERDGRATITYH